MKIQLNQRALDQDHQHEVQCRCLRPDIEFSSQLYLLVGLELHVIHRCHLVLSYHPELRPNAPVNSTQLQYEPDQTLQQVVQLMC